MIKTRKSQDVVYVENLLNPENRGIRTTMMYMIL